MPAVSKERLTLVKKLGDHLEKRKPEITKKVGTRKLLEEMVDKINDPTLQVQKLKRKHMHHLQK